MSEIKVNSIKGVGASTAAITVNNTDGTCTANITSVGGGALSNRRMNINGAVLINQRGNKTGLTSSGAPHYVVDRFRHYFTEGTFSISQENDAPAGSGFTKSLKIQCTTADTSQDAGATHSVTYPFEGQDLQGLAKGTSGAKQLAVQFWCKAFQTGTFNITLFDEDNSRFTNQNFTISTSNTWEKKELIFPADTTGAITADNSSSLNLDIKLAAGTNYTSGSLQTAWGASTTANSGVGQTVNIADNTNNNFYITGLQIEIGNVHTDFEHRTFAQELILCQRYCQKLGAGNGTYDCMATGNGVYNTKAYIPYRLMTTMRSTPSFTLLGSASDFYYTRDGGEYAVSNITLDQAGKNMVAVLATVSTGISNDEGIRLYNINNTGGLLFTAEV